MIVKTSRFWYRGANRMDITAKTTDDFGRLFAPPWALVMNFKKGKIDKVEYRRIYNKLLEKRRQEYRILFDELIERAEPVVMVCYCSPDEFCHRFLAAEFLVSIGAIYKGEVPIE